MEVIKLLLWRVAAVVWIVFMTALSHTPGEKSGAESRWLARTTGVDEAVLRRAAHVFLFLVLGLFAAEGWGWTGVAVAAVWGLVDEATKVWIPGRHFSWIDVGLNLIGCVIGLLVYLLIR